MVYRHIYWGRLDVGPNEDNLLTDAVKTKSYFVRIITPQFYRTMEEAAADEMEYRFEVFDDQPFITGIPRRSAAAAAVSLARRRGLE